jgi:chemotaxis protein methyltransferase CheR
MKGMMQSADLREQDFSTVATDQPALPLADREFEQIRDLAKRSFGLDLKDGKKDLVTARLQRLLWAGGFRSYRDYFRHVLSDATGESLVALIDALATNHTAFFREADHFEFLRRQVLPGLGGRQSLDVWSAACSTGEEVWSLVLLLREALPAVRFRVIGSDVSSKALASAVRAVYPAERIRVLPSSWQQSGFVRAPGTHGSVSVKPAIRRNAIFRRVNLIEPLSWPMRFPVIFCRNVMIYFDQITQKQVIANLSASLEPGGYLFVGHAESFSGIQHGLEYVGPAVYRKPAAKRGETWRP